MRSRYKFLNTGNFYFVTSSIVKWVKLFEDEKYINILIDIIRYQQEKKDFELFAYVIMKDHFHMVCRAEKLNNIMMSIKSYTAKKIIELLENDGKSNILKLFEHCKLKYKMNRKYQIWQEGYHPQEIIDSDMFGQKIYYMHNNPVKAGYVEDVLEWKYSSASDILLDINGPLKIIKLSS